MRMFCPKGRAAHSACTLQNNLFIFGGYDGKKKLNDICMLDCEKMKWCQPYVSGIPPKGRSYHSSCVINNKIYVFGGYDGRQRSNELFVLEKAMPTLKRLCVVFIKNNRRSVGNLTCLPKELKELVEK